MGVVIAVEGPDLSGKSTFLKTLREVPALARWPVFRMDVPTALVKEPNDPEIERISEAFNNSLVTMKKNISFMLDRCYVSSYVYSQVFGRQVDLGYLDRVSRELNPMVVYMRTPLDVVIDRLHVRGDLLAHNRTRLMALHAAYERWYDKNPFMDNIFVVGLEQIATPYGTAVAVAEQALKLKYRVER